MGRVPITWYLLVVLTGRAAPVVDVGGWSGGCYAENRTRGQQPAWDQVAAFVNLNLMRTLILSDIHLGNKHAQVRRLHEVLDRQPFDRLILNGDTLHGLNLRKLRADHWGLLTRFRELGRTHELILIRG